MSSCNYSGFKVNSYSFIQVFFWKVNFKIGKVFSFRMTPKLSRQGDGESHGGLTLSLFNECEYGITNSSAASEHGVDLFPREMISAGSDWWNDYTRTQSKQESLSSHCFWVHLEPVLQKFTPGSLKPPVNLEHLTRRPSVLPIHPSMIPARAVPAYLTKAVVSVRTLFPFNSNYIISWAGRPHLVYSKNEQNFSIFTTVVLQPPRSLRSSSDYL